MIPLLTIYYDKKTKNELKLMNNIYFKYLILNIIIHLIKNK